MNSFTLLEAMNGIREDAILHARQLLENKEERKMRSTKTLWRTLLIAAVLVSLFSVTAYATAQFQMRGRTGGRGESFAAHFGELSVDWPGEYVFEFDGPAECQEVQFKTTWAPNEDYWFPEDWAEDWTQLVEGRELYNEELQVYQAACVVDVMYAPQFTDGGAMILKGFTPDEMTRETWGDVEVYKFEATATHAFDAAQTVFPVGNFVILFHPEQGWIIGVRGYDSMENIEGIARGLEIRQTDRVIKSSDFENPYDFCDIYIG